MQSDGIGVAITMPGWVRHGKEPIYSVDIQPQGFRFVTAGGDKKAKIWAMAPLLDKSSQQDERQPKLLCSLDHSYVVNVVKWDGTGAFLATGSDAGQLRVWHSVAGVAPTELGSKEQNHENWQVLYTLHGHSSDVQDLCWSPDARFLASASLDSSVIVWHGPKMVVELKEHQSWVMGLAWDPVGKFLASLDHAGKLIIWNTDDWTSSATVENCVESRAIGKLGPSILNRQVVFARMSWDPLGSVIGLPGGYGEDRAFHSPIITRGTWARKLRYKGHTLATTVVRCNPVLFERHVEGKPRRFTLFAVGSKDQSVSVFLTSQHGVFVILKHFFKAAILDIAWTPDGYALLIASHDGTVAFFRFDEGAYGPGVRLPPERLKQLLREIHGERSTPIVENAWAFKGVPSHGPLPVVPVTIAPPTRSEPPPPSLPCGEVLEYQTEIRTVNGRRKITPVTSADLSKIPPKPTSGITLNFLSTSSDRTSPFLNLSSSSSSCKESNSGDGKGIDSGKSGSGNSGISDDRNDSGSGGSGGSSSNGTRNDIFNTPALIAIPPSHIDLTSSPKTSTLLPSLSVTSPKAAVASFLAARSKFTPVKTASTVSPTKAAAATTMKPTSPAPSVIAAKPKKKRQRRMSEDRGLGKESKKTVMEDPKKHKELKKGDTKKYQTEDEEGKKKKDKKEKPKEKKIELEATHPPTPLLAPEEKQVEPAAWIVEPAAVRPSFSCTYAGHVVNAEAKNASTIVSLFGDGVKQWEDVLPRTQAVLLGASSKIVACAVLEDEGEPLSSRSGTCGRLYVYSSAGGRILPCMALSSLPACLSCSDHYVMILTADGAIKVWDVCHLRIAVSTRLCCLVSSSIKLQSVTLSPLAEPIAILSNRFVYQFSRSLETWVRVQDDRFFGSPFNSVSTAQSSSILQLASSPPATPSLSLALLETRRARARLFGSGTEFQDSTTQYVAQLVGLAGGGLTWVEVRLREVVDDLIGPPHAVDTQASARETEDWAPYVFGCSKRELLRALVPLLDSSPALQRLAAYVHECVGHWDS